MTFWEIIADETFAFWDIHTTSLYLLDIGILKSQLATRITMFGG